MDFKKKLLACAAIASLAFAPLAATAQVFDPLSKSLGGTMTGNIVYNNGVPTVTGTGSPTVAAGSSSTAGSVTAGSSATSVVITFGVAQSNGNAGFLAIPFCQVQSETQLAAFSYVVTKTTITITQTATSGNIIVWECNPSA